MGRRARRESEHETAANRPVLLTGTPQERSTGCEGTYHASALEVPRPRHGGSQPRERARHRDGVRPLSLGRPLSRAGQARTSPAAVGEEGARRRTARRERTDSRWLVHAARAHQRSATAAQARQGGRDVGGEGEREGRGMARTHGSGEPRRVNLVAGGGRQLPEHRRALDHGGVGAHLPRPREAEEDPGPRCRALGRERVPARRAQARDRLHARRRREGDASAPAEDRQNASNAASLRAAHAPHPRAGGVPLEADQGEPAPEGVAAQVGPREGEGLALPRRGRGALRHRRRAALLAALLWVPEPRGAAPQRSRRSGPVRRRP